MHTFIPHRHFDELSNTEKQELENPDSFLDYVKIMFLTDLGEGHMETFDQGEKYDFDTEAQIDHVQKDFPRLDFIHFSDKPLIELETASSYLDDVPILRRLPDAHIDFRGPPSQV